MSAGRCLEKLKATPQPSAEIEEAATFRQRLPASSKRRWRDRLSSGSDGNGQGTRQGNLAYMDLVDVHTRSVAAMMVRLGASE